MDFNPAIPERASSDHHIPRCCCGHTECAYLDYNNAALEGLEKDVATAAQLGQALLHRHESYMAEAEEERVRMVDSIEKLEQDKRDLEDANQRIVEENRGLLEELEGLNNSVSESDAQIKLLTETLLATQREVRRLTVLATRTSELERQLSQMETEQAQLHSALSTVEEDKTTAMQRWRRAEVTLRNLQDQVERIEAEAREEREKHVELVGRMERRRAVEKELDGAAGRLKGAAAAQTLGRNQKGTNVVSHFVRDILQDNANLQMGIVELREMLQTSNEEVQNLRDQILQHQPLALDAGVQSATPLSEELKDQARQDAAKEFHIHHHYHGPEPSAKKERIQLPRRPKKRRGLPPMITPRSQLRQPSPTTPSSAATIMSQTSVTIPQSPISTQRWSVQSSATALSAPFSSVPSSPLSAYRTSSIFDRMDHGFESSRPTSPESNGWSSPLMSARRRKNLSDVSFRSFSGPLDLPEPGSPIQESRIESTDPKELPLENPAELQGDDVLAGLDSITHPIILEEEQEDIINDSTTSPPTSEDAVTPEDVYPSFHQSTQLRRSASHDSLLSISGMDIHTLDHRSSNYFSHFNPKPFSTSASSQPTISTTNVTANRPTIGSKLSSQSLLSSFAASGAPSTHSDDSTSTTSEDRPTLGKRVGGWVWGRWGMAPVPTKDNLRAQAALNSVASCSSDNKVHDKEPVIRSFGVNQKGPILGLKPPARTPSQVHAKVVNEGLLRESLAEADGE